MSRKTERVGSLFREEISELLRREVKDPRLSGVFSVAEVEVTPDLRYAHIYISIMGSEEEKKGVMSGLESASGFIRRELAHRLQMRRIPELIFVRDDSIEKGSRLLRIIDELSEKST